MWLQFIVVLIALHSNMDSVFDQSKIDQYAKQESLKAPISTMIGSQLADIGSTLYAKSHGAQEANPLIPNSAAMMGIKGAYAVANYLIMKHLAENGHPTAAKIMGYTSAIPGSIAAIHNLTLSHR